ncbi:MAG: phosphoribosylformylglycinamidine synthase subunit PurQ, partial [Selenomonas sp.]
FAVNVMKASEAISAEFKYANSKVYAIEVPIDANDLPVFANLRRNYERVHALMQSRRVFSASSVGRGGIAAALTKMCLGNSLGFKAAPGAIKFEDLFRPAYGTILLEMSEAVNVTDALAGVKWTLLGRTTTVASIVCNGMVQTLDELRETYTGALDGIFPARAGSRGRTASAAAPFRRGVRQRASDRYAKPRIFMPVFPGVNCEYETQRAFEKAGGEVDALVIRNLTPQAVEESVQAIASGINKAQILMLPGGFSGGDEPDGSGKFIAATLRNPRIAEAIMELLQKREGLILGICNGFQALVKLGLLPYGKIMPLDWESPTLTHNTIGRHVSCMVQTRIMSNLSPWFNNVSVGDIHTIPVSHGEGRFVADKEIIARMRIRGQIAAQYVDEAGEPTMESPFNPNGSTEAIEAITSPNGRILGKMGHSERFGDNISKNVPGNKEQGLFDAGVRFFR